MTIEIILDGNKKQFRPFDVIEGKIIYNLVKPCATIQVDLAWTTIGKGTTDSCAVDSTGVSTMGKISGDGRFRLAVPAGPYSFSGKLVSIVWLVSCGAESDLDIAETEITISPSGKELVI